MAAQHHLESRIGMDYDINKIKRFVQDHFGLALTKISKIESGVINTNFKVSTDHGRKYIFRVYNNRVREQVYFEKEVLNYLIKFRFISPKLIHSRTKEQVLLFENKPCVMYEYIDGKIQETFDNSLIFKIGAIEGRLHNILIDFKPTAFKPSWEPTDLPDLIARHGAKFIKSGFPSAREITDFVEKELTKYSFPNNLPSGVTHQDIKPENVVLNNNEIVGLLDFDNSYVGAFIHDITTTIIWTCFENHELKQDAVHSLLKGYSQERKLTRIEKENLLHAIKFRLVREIFIGPLVTPCYPELSKKRADYFFEVYKKLEKDQKLRIVPE